MRKYSDIEIRVMASDTLAFSGYSDIFPVPVDKVIESKGFKLFGVKADVAPQGFSGLIDHSGKEIIINSSHSVTRRRFTAAHELGHLVLHGKKDGVDYQLSLISKEPKEIEANLFANEILMPPEKFLEILKSTNRNLAATAAYFDVSVAAAEIRANELSKLNLFESDGKN